MRGWPTSAATETLGEPAMRELERRVVLSVIDRRWRDHLYEMDYLKDGIGLRAMAQRDPLVEYQREGFTLFQTMMEADPRGVDRLPVQPRGRGERRRRRHSGGAAGRGEGSRCLERAGRTAQLLGAIGQRRSRGAQPARPDRAGRNGRKRGRSRRRQSQRSVRRSAATRAVASRAAASRAVVAHRRPADRRRRTGRSAELRSASGPTEPR